MNYSIIKYFIAITFIFISCTILLSQIRNRDIIGSWELISYIDDDIKTGKWSSYTPEIIYQKHITDTHFTWFKYDQKKDELLGMGGGTYRIDENGKYVEDIAFFYPPGSSELGQTIPFDLEIEKGVWYHKGYAKRMTYSENGEVIIKDSIKIEEKWSPILPSTMNDKDLLGTWNLVSFRNRLDEPYIEYPEFTAYLKLITPTNFVWIKYDKEDDQIFAAGAGTYNYRKNKYEEILKVTFPVNSIARNKKILFVPKITGQKWHHLGRIPGTENSMSNEGYIDEIWMPFKSTAGN
jgi:hypothetical protein